MALALEKALTPAAGWPPLAHSDHRLNVAVVFTSTSATVAALRTAGTLARALNARLRLILAQVVPYPLPLQSPPVLLELSRQRLRELASTSPVETSVHIYLCRDRLDLLKSAFTPRSLLVIGGHRHWWPTRERRLADQLRCAGHDVIFTETD